MAKRSNLRNYWFECFVLNNTFIEEEPIVLNGFDLTHCHCHLKRLEYAMCKLDKVSASNVFKLYHSVNKHLQLPGSFMLHYHQRIQKYQ